MKKFLVIIFLLLLAVPTGAGLFANSCTLFASALTKDNIHYLISPNFISEDNYQSKYNIVDSAEQTEVLRHTRPFDFDNQCMMNGVSISPQKIDEKINKTFGVNQALINQDISLFTYIYFTEIYNRDLSLSLIGDGFSVSWTINSNTIQSEVDHSSDTSHIRYGWMLLELPFSAAKVEGTPGLVTGLNIVCDTSSMESELVGKPYFYAPYLATTKTNNINFSLKQNYFIFNVDYKLLNNYCTGDSYYITNLKSLLKYAIIGEVDYLLYPTTDYHFNLEIINTATGKKVSQKILDNSFNYKFDSAATYQFMVALYNSAGIWQWQTASVSLVVNDFVPFYINSGIKDMNVGGICEYNLFKGSYANYITNVKVTSSNTNVAEVSLKDGNIVVSAKKAGKATIVVTADVGRNGSEKQYVQEYEITVTKPSRSPWVKIAVWSIVLIICGILVYTIMVKRRLIKNKYPKY